MREVLHTVLKRRVDFMKRHIEPPTILKIDKTAHEKLCQELADLVPWDARLMGEPNPFGNPVRRLYGLQVIIVDGPEWLEVT